VNVDFEPHGTKPHKTGVQFITRQAQQSARPGVQ
jgi:hypothetical protein